jgi:hypothetical protein
MTIQSLRLIVALSLLMPYSYAFQPVPATNNGITITAQAMTKEQSLDTFYQDMHTNHIYPIAVSVTNQGGKAVSISSNCTKILNAELLTPKSIDAKIRSLDNVSLFLVVTIVLIPLALATSHRSENLSNIKPIIDRFSLGDTPITIEPGTTLKTIVFAEINYPKDAEGKTLSYVAPKSLNMSIELSPTSWFDFSATNKIELTIPTTINP